MTRKPLPPFGRELAIYLLSGGRSGPFVAIGPGAWSLARRRQACYPVAVIPCDRDPLDFRFDFLRGLPAVLLEVGCFDTDRLERAALAMLTDGAQRVVPIRDATLAGPTPQSWPIYVQETRDGRAA